MEEEIEILEKLIQFLKSDDVEETFDDFTPEILALGNLLKAYKELKEENKELKKELRIAKDTIETKDIEAYGSIPKSKIKEKIEELKTKKKEYGFGSIESTIFLNEIHVLQQILGEE